MYNSSWETGFEYLADYLFNVDFYLLSKQEDCNIYHYPTLNIVVKEKISHISLKREFDIGLIANSYNNHHIVKTLGYFEDQEKSYLVTQYVQGELLADKQDYNKYYKKVLEIIKELQEVMDFTHYDPHMFNIIIEPNDNIVFIDLSRSYIKGIESRYTEIEIIDSATTPGVFDPMFDFGYILGVLLEINGINRDGIQLLEQNKFTIRDGVGYPVVDEIVPLINQNIIWASTVPGLYTMKEINAKYDILFNKGYFQLEDNYIIELGLAAVHDKLVMIKSRDDTPDIFYDSIMTYISNLIMEFS